MKENKSRWHLFQAYGVELEYMIVDEETLDVRPIADTVLLDEEGNISGEIEFGDVAWSNELVSHVIEIKSNGPKADLVALNASFQRNIEAINTRLKPAKARLLSSAAHPWMNPSTDSKLWAHENQDIYHAYDRIFNCKGHGWSNLQSTHLNLPFYDDEEFSKLHTAIRFMLPLIPALTASSPILSGKFSGHLDKRLFYYQTNQSVIPVLTGKVIPELVFTKYGYQKQIYDRIAEAIKPHDTDGILNPIWLNSRGAMARFDRGAIEIRIMDIQECPKADLAIVSLVIGFIKLLVKGKWISFEVQKSFGTNELHDIFERTIKSASSTLILHPQYLKALGYSEEVSCKQIWQDLIMKIGKELPQEIEPWQSTLEDITRNGTLAERIVQAIDGNYAHQHVKEVYTRLATCLERNLLFMP